MSPQELLRKDHETLRQLAATIKKNLTTDRTRASALVGDFQKLVQQHFRREDSFYKKIDGGKQVPDRGLMHSLRNDHAAVLFTLESLAIKLRKGGPTQEWEQRLNSMFSVLLPHLDREEIDLFPLAAALPSEDQAALIAEMKANE
jgi:hypothetical protein